MALSTRQLRSGLVLVVALVVAGVWWGNKLLDRSATPEVTEPNPVEVTAPPVEQTVVPVVAVPPPIAESTIELPEIDPELTAEQILELGDQALLEDHLALPLQGSALHYYASLLQREPENEDAAIGFASVIERLFAEAETAIEADDVAEAAARLPTLVRFSSDQDRVGQLRQEIDVRQALASLLVGAEQALSEGRLHGDSGAGSMLIEAVALGQASEELVSLAREVRQAMVSEAIELARDHRYANALGVLEEAQLLPGGDGQAVTDARVRIGQFLDLHVQSLELEANQLLLAGRVDDAVDVAAQLGGLGAAKAQQRVEDEISEYRVYGPFHPRQKFHDEADGITGPQMVVLPAGSFRMGSTSEDASFHEQPVHEVRFGRGFALAVHETSVREFTRFVDATGYRTDAETQGHTQVFDEATGRTSRRSRVNWRYDLYGKRADPDMPVIHVSFADAQAYARWLADTLQQPYRLPGEAEFEYALRSGSTSTYWWGEDSPPQVVENVTGSGDRSPRRRSWTKAFRGYDDGYWGPAPVASFQANAFGLHDMGGNVSEWVVDCWHDTYLRAPRDGTAWVNPGCERRVIRGGSWSSPPQMVRSAWRSSGPEDYRDVRVGFRVARDIAP